MSFGFGLNMSVTQTQPVHRSAIGCTNWPYLVSMPTQKWQIPGPADVCKQTRQKSWGMSWPYLVNHIIKNLWTHCLLTRAKGNLFCSSSRTCEYYWVVSHLVGGVNIIKWHIVLDPGCSKLLASTSLDKVIDLDLHWETMFTFFFKGHMVCVCMFIYF